MSLPPSTKHLEKEKKDMDTIWPRVRTNIYCLPHKNYESPCFSTVAYCLVLINTYIQTRLLLVGALKAELGAMRSDAATGNSNVGGGTCLCGG